MPRITAPARLAALAIALLLPMLAWVAPAHAADPKPVTVTLRAEADLEEATTINLSASVAQYPRPTGTYTYRDADNNIIGTGPALPSGGTYPVTVPKPAGPTTFTVDFDSDTDAYADGTGTLNWVAANIKTVTVTPQPTLLKITGLVPTLTLTLADSFKLKDGTGVAGIEVYHYLLCDPGPQRYCGLHVPICRAVSDANGLASCKGSGTLGAIVSILAGGALQTLYHDTANPTRNYNYDFKGTTYPIIG